MDPYNIVFESSKNRREYLSSHDLSCSPKELQSSGGIYLRDMKGTKFVNTTKTIG